MACLNCKNLKIKLNNKSNIIDPYLHQNPLGYGNGHGYGPAAGPGWRHGWGHGDGLYH